MQKDSTSRFSERVENYIKYRPDYPASIIQFLESKRILTIGSVVADVGSGTGLSSALFLNQGYPVVGIEPNDMMREAAERQFRNNNNFKSVKGTAEATTLEVASVDVVIAGQAFHWFDMEGSRLEFGRILKENKYVVLIWNERRELAQSEFMASYEHFLLKYSTDYVEIDHRKVDESTLANFYNKEYGFDQQTFENEQVFDEEGLRGRYLSCSYALKEEDSRYLEALNVLDKLFRRYEEGGSVKMEYLVRVYYGQV